MELVLISTETELADGVVKFESAEAENYATREK